MRLKKMQKIMLGSGLFGLLSAFMLILTLSPLLAAKAKTLDSQKGPTWRFATPKDIPAPVQRAAIDPVSGATYLATLFDLFEVKNGQVMSIAERPHQSARLLLAPDGGVYAWLIPNENQGPLVTVRLVDISGEHLSELRLDKAPYGFGGLHLGSRGRLVVTVSALDDWQGSKGRFLYGFWSRDGKLLKTLERPQKETTIIAADGTSVLLLGMKEALAFSPKGELLWRLEGQFRKAAIAAGGKVALLNPADRKAINSVYVFRGSGKPSVVKMPTPVHKLRLTPDGSTAVVTGSGGRYFFLDPAKGRIDKETRPPFDASLFISDIEFIDHETIAVGVLERHGDPPRHSWPRGGLAVIDRKGKVKFRSHHAIREPFSSRPAVDAAFGTSKFIGFTLDEALQIEIGR